MKEDRLSGVIILLVELRILPRESSVNVISLLSPGAAARTRWRSTESNDVSRGKSAIIKYLCMDIFGIVVF